MSFKIFNTLEQRFQRFRKMSVILVVSSQAIACWAIYSGSHEASRERKIVYVISSGKAIPVMAVDETETLTIEMRDHLRTFHRYFFDLDPNEKGIKEGVTRSFYLADSSAKKLFDDQVEKGFINALVSGNIIQRVNLDSIWIDTRNEPYLFRCFGTQTLTRATTVTTRSIVTRGEIIRVHRADNNPHGFTICHFEVEDNKEMKTVNRQL